MATGDLTPKRLVGPVALAASNATVGSAVPTGKRWIVKQIVLLNTNTSTGRTVQFAIGTSATAANRIIDQVIAARDALVLNTALVLEAAEQFSANQGTGTDVTCTVTGIEQTL